MTFATDYDIAVSPGRIGFVLFYQNGLLRLASGMELPAETLQAGPSYNPVPADLGSYPAIYVAVEHVLDTHLSRNGFFVQINPEAALLSAQLRDENWCLADNEGRFSAAGILRPYDSNAGHCELQWLGKNEERDAALQGTEVVRLPGGVWSGRCFAWPIVPPEKRFVCQIPRGLEPVCKLIFERSAILLSQARAWVRIQLPQRVEPLYEAVTAVHLNAATASNIGCFNQTVRFAEAGATIPISREAGAQSFLVAPLSVTGESGRSYLPEFHPSLEAGIGRFRLHQGHLTLLPGLMPDGRPDAYANVRVWTTLGSAGNQMGVTCLRAFTRNAPSPHLAVTNITAGAGGTDGEDFGSAKSRFAMALLSRERLWTQADIQAAIRAFDRRVVSMEVHPDLVRTSRGLRRLLRIVIGAQQEAFVAPEEEAHVLASDLRHYLSERMPLDLQIRVETKWV
jgi:hypothetical protein